MSFYSNLPTGQTESVSRSSLYPTIFEILSSQEIDALLPASIRYILTNYWVARFPSRFTLAVNNFFPEWFNLGLKGLVEWHHISSYDSTFIDKFYGLQRFNSTNKVLMNAQVHSMASNHSGMKYWSRGLQLTRSQKQVLFMQKIILPYLREKLDELHSKIVAQSAFSNVEFSKLKKWLLESFYPVVKKAWYILDLLTKLAFLSGKIGSITFLDFLFKIEYTRMALPLQSSLLEKNKAMSASRPPRTNFYTFWRECSKCWNKINLVLSYSGSQLFPAFIFMLRVYQWWTTQDLSAKLQRKLNDVDRDIPRSHPGDREKNKSTSTCPICKKEIQNPCILETGYAACYPCAFEFLPMNEGRCPVTGKRLLGCQYDKTLGKWNVLTGVRKLLV